MPGDDTEILGANQLTNPPHPPTHQNPTNLWSIYKKFFNHPLGLTLSIPSLVYLFIADTGWQGCLPQPWLKLTVFINIWSPSGADLLVQVLLWNKIESYRFNDSKTTIGKLRFFFHLCEKLKHDMGEFAEILAPSRKGFNNRQIQIIKPTEISILVLVREGLQLIEKVSSGQ